MGEKRKIALTVNGKRYEEEVEVRVTLADFVRHQLGLTGTHLGCEHGVCGACTILLDGRSARSCLMLAVQADGHELLTVEGIAPSPDELHVLQQCFHEHHGLQCGFCTPGMLTTLLEFLRDNPDPTEQEVRIAISGNLCRCTGYQNIVTAALDAAKRMRELPAQARCPPGHAWPRLSLSGHGGDEIEARPWPSASTTSATASGLSAWDRGSAP